MKREETQEDLSVVGTGVLANENGSYLVPSASDPTRDYVVEQHPTHLSCTCKDHFYRGRRCKHIAAVVAHKQRVQLAVARQSLEEVQCDLVEMNASATTVSRVPVEYGAKSAPRQHLPQSQLNRTRPFSFLA